MHGRHRQLHKIWLVAGVQVTHLGVAAAALALLLTACTQPSAHQNQRASPIVPYNVDPLEQRQLFGAFLGSDVDGVERTAGFEQFLGGAKTRVGHTYLPGENWTGVEGPDFILDPWSSWRVQNPSNLFVLNVPMVTPNEGNLSDEAVASRLRSGANGAYDEHFAVLARRLVQKGLHNAVLVPGWEMNGTTYSHRCGPDPLAWKAYFRRVVSVMRSEPGQAFRFDFTPSRGTDSIPWPECYPGDDVVDIIGMDTYDQPPGMTFEDYVEQPDGLQDQVDFAASRGKPLSYPEWGLFRYGDNAEYVREMHEWITTHDTVYSTLTDYCPHGVFWCAENPRAAQAVRELFGADP